VRVGKVLESVVRVRGKLTNEEAADFVKGMKENGRINADVFETMMHVGCM
jgi:hypothetical protein